MPVELLRHNEMSFVRFLLKPGNGFLSVQTTIKWWFVRILLTSKNVSLLVKIMKTPYFKNSLKNPIFEIEDSNMDQMKENYLTHMNLVLTHFCQNVVLYGFCSQRLILLIQEDIKNHIHRSIGRLKHIAASLIHLIC